MEAPPHPLSSRLPRRAVGANSGFPTTLHQSTATYAAFLKESRRRFTDATKPDRKSGGSRGTCSSLHQQPMLSQPPRTPPPRDDNARSQANLSSREFVTFSIFRVFCIQRDVFQSPPETRHPERSASQIYRITEGFMARSRRTPAMLVGRCSSELSGHRLQGKLKKSQPLSGAPQALYHAINL
jgi:hypothetical protein